MLLIKIARYFYITKNYFNNIIYLFICILFVCFACHKNNSIKQVQKPDSQKLQINGDSCIDYFIYNNFTVPYGIDVTYLWERNFNSNHIANNPPKLEKVKEVLATLKFIWIGLYKKFPLWDNLLKTAHPLRIVLYGEKNIDPQGVILLSGGNKSAVEMQIYDVNNFSMTDTTKVYTLMRSVYHQWSKRLAELVPYDREVFLKISRKDYQYTTVGEIEQALSTQRNNMKDYFRVGLQSLKKGFFTTHARITPNDDFAETISAILTTPATEIADLLTKIRSPLFAVFKPATYNPDNTDKNGRSLEDDTKDKAQAIRIYEILTQKQDFVEQYFVKTLGISLKQFQLYSVSALQNMKIPPINCESK